MYHGLTQRTHVHEHYLMLLLLLLCGLSVITGRSWRSADKSASLHADTDTDTGVWHERFYRHSVNVKSDGPVCYPSSGRCSPNADCLTVSGKTYCVCKDGYQGDGSTCTQVDYCKMGAESCPGNSDCFNNVTVTYCQCKSGFSLGGLDNTQCQVDSCWTNPCGDPSISICYAYPNGYDCGCVSGYTWKDNKCVDVDECATSTHKCSEHATCTNTPGSYNCTCAEGYLNIDGKGRKCVYDVMLHIKTVSQCLVKEDDAITMVNLGGNSLQFGRTAHSEVYVR